MSKELILRIKDELLLRAVSIILSEEGYSFVTGGEGLPTVTDDKDLQAAYGSVLYLLREEPTDKKRYVLLPISAKELTDAVNELAESEKNSSSSKTGELHLDAKNRRASFDGKRVTLTEKECMLLMLLIKNRGKTVADAELIEKVWKNETAENSNITAVYVNYLRNKLEGVFGQRLIYRVRGQGYMLKENERKN